jgi:hypothetical protein
MLGEVEEVEVEVGLREAVAPAEEVVALVEAVLEVGVVEVAGRSTPVSSRGSMAGCTR